MEYKELGKTGEKIPVLGMGTWKMGGNWYFRDTSNDERDIEALKLGLKLGMKFIDTAEGYGRGHAEELVAEAIKGEENVFIATKISPEHFRFKDVLKSCERSLERLKVKQIDLYQLHWPNPYIPIEETMKAMEKLVKDGKIRYIGVSNFSVEEMIKAQEAMKENEIVSNQVEYSLLVRDVERDILPFCKKEKITLIAYSPLAQGRLFKKIPREPTEVLNMLSEKYKKTIAQIALNWLISKEEVIAIPKASNKGHVKENIGAIGWKLKKEDLNLLEKAIENCHQRSLKSRLSFFLNLRNLIS